MGFLAVERFGKTILRSEARAGLLKSEVGFAQLCLGYPREKIGPSISRRGIC